MTTEAIGEKIKKLLALAANNPSQAESASALAKAQALMTEHKIEQATLENSKPNEEDIFAGLGSEDGVTRSYWKLTLASYLGSANGVFVYKSGKTIGLVGKKSNIQSVTYMFQYCISEIERLSKANCKGLGHSYANDFKRGCVSAIASAIRFEREQLEKRMREQASAMNGERGLIVLNNAIAKINRDFDLAKQAAYSPQSGLRLRAGSYSGTRVKTSGYEQGQKVGASIYPGSRSKIGSNQGRLN